VRAGRHSVPAKGSRIGHIFHLTQSDIERFWSKVNKTESCWNWTAGIRGKCGYGAFRLNGRTISAHRISYEVEYGKIPDNSCVLHKCDNRICVRPSHLFLGTLLDNIKDMDNKGRRNTHLHCIIVNCLICNKQIITRTREGPRCCCSRNCGTKLAWKIRKENITTEQLAIMKKNAVVKDFYTTGLYSKIRE